MTAARGYKVLRRARLERKDAESTMDLNLSKEDMLPSPGACFWYQRYVE